MRFDVFGILRDVVGAPGSVGLSNVTDPCIALDTKVHAFCAKPDSYLFWDGIHPTVAGHRILAQRAKAALNAASALTTAP